MSSFPQNQVNALYCIYNVTQGDEWTWNACRRSHWNFVESNINPCLERWCGITCNKHNTTIIQLNLGNYRMNGTLPSCLSELSDITILDIQFNFLLVGSIPIELAKLTKLQSLTLPNNNLLGTIPPIFENMTSLTKIDFGYNRFEGSIPAIFQQLTAIQEIHLTENKFNGHIDLWLSPSQLENLHVLDLRDNLFSGTFPATANLTKLTNFYINSNQFTGTIPDIFYLSSQLKFIDCEYNQFHGRLPPSINTIKNLTQIVVGVNRLSGPLDSMIDWSQFTKLDEVSVNDNYFTGGFPESLCFATYLFVLNVGSNILSGQLPNSCQDSLFLNLQVLAIEGNHFTGPLHQLFLTDEENVFSDLAVGNNLFTGSLPGEFFLHSSQLRVYGAGGNCLSGTLPLEICKMPLIQVFAADGASVASNCRIPIINIDTFGLNAFYTKTLLHGTIPECIFDLPQLNSLFLFGNGFTGSLPNVNIKGLLDLQRLSLSNNYLTGTIPPSWLENHAWLEFDVSHNKFIGTLPKNSAFPSVGTPPSIYLDVNRFSGSIPSSVQVLTDLRVLKGNLFSCPLINENGLPQHDPDYNVYVCGSNLVNLSAYIWLSVVIIVPILFLFFRKKANRTTHPYRDLLLEEDHEEMEDGVDEDFKTTLHSYKKLDSKAAAGQSMFFRVREVFRIMIMMFRKNIDEKLVDELNVMQGKEILNFFSFTLRCRVYALRLVCFIIMILFPIYSVLGLYYRTYDERYAWTISGIYLSGTTATVVLFISLAFFLLFAFYSLRKIFPFPNWRQSILVGFRWASRRWQTGLLWGLVWIINFAIMITADSVYVYLMINKSVQDEFIIQITLAMFKIAWNEIGMFQVVGRMKRWFPSFVTNEEQEQNGKNADFPRQLSEGSSSSWHGGSIPLLSPAQNTSNQDLSKSTHSTPTISTETISWFSERLLTVDDIRYLTYISIVNKVIIPCIAISFISSSCFYNALVAETPRAASYTVCYSGYDIIDYSCINILGSRKDDAYSPPFSYSYECSNAFLTDYVPVYIFMFLWSSLLLPSITIVADKVYTDLLTRQANDPTLQNHQQSRFDTFAGVVCEMVLPMSWKRWNKEVPFRDKMQQILIHRKQLLTLRVSYSFAILFVFGLLFPPLAVIAAIAIVNITLLEERLTKMMIEAMLQWQETAESFSIPGNRIWLKSYLNEECKGLDRNLYPVMKLIFGLTSFMVGFVLFDICGDRNGWKFGLIPAFLMILFPYCLYLVHDCCVRSSSRSNVAIAD